MAEPLKKLFSSALIDSLAIMIEKFYSPFNSKGFIEDVFNNTWDEKELKQRMRHITDCINKHIPLPYQQQIEILSKV